MNIFFLLWCIALKSYKVLVHSIAEHNESFMRIPPGQTIEVECLAGDAIKVGVCFYINDGSLVSGKNNCDFDLWRIKHNETVKISYM